MTERPTRQDATQHAAHRHQDTTHCPHCGTELARATIDFEQTPDLTESLDRERAEFQPGEMAMVAYCPNEDCPGRASGEALNTGAQV